MYQNDFYLGSVSPPRRRCVYRNSINRRAHEGTAGPNFFRSNDVVMGERRHSLESADNNMPVYEKYVRPGVYTAPHTKLSDDGARISYISYMNGETFFEEEDQAHVIDTENVVRNLTTVGRFLEMLQGLPLPRLSLTTACICFIVAIFISPRPCAQTIIFPAFRLSFGTLYPAYASYKAVRTKNVKEYVKWMMYWIVYAFFTCIETFTDIFLSWFPFYYEVKVVLVLWLLSPATKGSSTLYRKFVHPMLTRREQEIDEYLNQAKERGYSAVLQLGSKGVNYATNVIMQTAIKGGGNLVQTIRRSYSLSDLSEPDMHRTQDEIDDVVTMRPQQRMLRPRLNTPVGRSASGTRHSTGMYFTEVDVTAKGAGDFNYNIRSSDDISSGYSSAEPISAGLSRTSSMTNASKTRLKAKRSEVDDISDDVISNINNGQPYFSHHVGYTTNLAPVNDFEDAEEMDSVYESDEFFETKSNASTNKNADGDNVKERSSSQSQSDTSSIQTNVNVNQLRSSLKEIEENFRDKMSTSCTTLPRSKKAEKAIATTTAKTRSSRHEK